MYSNLIKYKSGEGSTYVILPSTSNLFKRFAESGVILSQLYPSTVNDGNKEYNPFSASYVGDDKVGELLNVMHKQKLESDKAALELIENERRTKALEVIALEKAKAEEAKAEVAKAKAESKKKSEVKSETKTEAEPTKSWFNDTGDFTVTDSTEEKF